jgi:hypothetical protein
MGYARHGKDTVCEILRDDYALTFCSSSFFCAAKVVMPALKEKYGYKSIQECFDDRHNHRAEWHDLIKEFNATDLSRLSRAIFANYNIYAGIRNHREYFVAKNANVFDHSIWIDRSMHQPNEDKSSCSVEPWMADFILDNNGSIDDLRHYLSSLLTNRLGLSRAK